LVRFVGSKLYRPVGDQATVPGSLMALVGLIGMVRANRCNST
jgi:hypothetical protein